MWKQRSSFAQCPYNSDNDDDNKKNKKKDKKEKEREEGQDDLQEEEGWFICGHLG